MVEDFPDLAVFPGSETLMLAGLEIGARGCISASANCNPHGIRLVYDAVTTGAKGARPLNDTMCAVRVAMDRPTGVRASKAVLAHYRRDPGWNRFRPPLAALDDESTNTLIEAIEGAGFDPSPLRKV
jgi:4-hydroxy-tetrahydrodipicolinate synthase